MLFVQLAGLSLAFSHANAEEILFPQCPPEIPIQQTVKGPSENGWNIVNNHNTQRLRGIGISAGEYPTVQTGLEIPTEEKNPDGDVIAHYQTPTLPNGEHDYWAVCWFSQSDIVLVQKLPEYAVRCEVRHRNEPLAPDRVTIKCFDTPRKTK